MLGASGRWISKAEETWFGDPAAERVLVADLMAAARRVAATLSATLQHPFTREGGLFILAQYASAVAGLAVTVIAARVLGPRGYGSVAVIFAYPQLIWTFLSAKPSSVLIRHVSVNAEANRWGEVRAYARIGYVIALVSSSAFLVVVAVAPLWSPIAPSGVPGVKSLILWVAASIPFKAVSAVSVGLLVSLRKPKHAAFFSVFERILVLLLVLVAVRIEFTIWSYLGAVVLGEILASVITILWTLRVLNPLLSTHVDRGDWRKALQTLRSEMQWNYLFVCMGGVLFQLPLLVLSHVGGPRDAAFFKLSLSVVTTTAYIESGLWKVASPVLSRRAFATGASGLSTTIRRWTLRAGLPLGVVVLLAAAVVPLLIPYVFGQEYAPMERGMQIMLIGAAASVVFFVLAPAYFASGHVRAWVVAYSVYSFVTVGAGSVAASMGGFTGMAVVFGLSTTALNVVMAWLAPQILSRPHEGGPPDAISVPGSKRAGDEAT